MRKLLFCVFILGLSVFVVLDCRPAAGGYGIIDYVNILFCNTRQYPLYGRTIWQIVNLLFFLAIINAGIFFLSESHCNFSKGYRSLVLIRYEKTSRYLFHVVKFSFVETVKYIVFVAANCLLVLLLIDRSALTFTSLLYKLPVVSIVFYGLLYSLKIMLFFGICKIPLENI